MKWLVRIFCVLFGMYAGGVFVSQAWTPLLIDTPHEDVSFSHITEAGKRAFFRTLYETYESENPNSEMHDAITNQRPSDEELRQHYEWFDRVLMNIRVQGCPTKQVTVPSRWADSDAIDRVFQVFDIERCQ